MISLVPLATQDHAAVEHLLDRAFGGNRHARTAYKVRGNAAPIAALGFAAIEAGPAGDVLVGSIQCWPVALRPDAGEAVPMVMVGPVAVAPERQRAGIGRRLVAAALDAAETTTLDAAMMLIGDPGYYGRFGFTADATADWRLPGPVERHRLLARGRAVPATAGMLGPAATVPA